MNSTFCLEKIPWRHSVVGNTSSATQHKTKVNPTTSFTSWNLEELTEKLSFWHVLRVQIMTFLPVPKSCCENNGDRPSDHGKRPDTWPAWMFALWEVVQAHRWSEITTETHMHQRSAALSCKIIATLLNFCDHHCACAQKWCHFSYFSKSFQKKKEKKKKKLRLYNQRWLK